MKSMQKIPSLNDTLNGACPYFTMFPLNFPFKLLKRYASRNSIVLDPFCGRGTTNFAARLLGLYSVGIDSSPVASAIASGKLVNTNANDILAEARRVLSQEVDYSIPSGEFWELAYHPEILNHLCKMRAVLNQDCESDERKALRLIILGALHGPKQKIVPNYFSNQCTRTYAPKPRYAVKFWTQRGLLPEKVDLERIIYQRANKYFSNLPEGRGIIKRGDSRTPDHIPNTYKYNMVITSPPYYGMNTYIPDQWIRHWFLGGPDYVDYSNLNQIAHSHSQTYVDDLRRVWENCYEQCHDQARLIIRFGGIADRNVEPKPLIKLSLKGTGWKLQTIKSAGTAHKGRRQADTFLKNFSEPIGEYDIWAYKG